MKNYARWIAGCLFLLFFIIGFWSQKTIIIKFNNYYLPVLTYTRDVRSLMESIGKDSLLWKMDTFYHNVMLFDGKIIDIDAFWVSP